MAKQVLRVEFFIGGRDGIIPGTENGVQVPLSAIRTKKQNSLGKEVPALMNIDEYIANKTAEGYKVISLEKHDGAAITEPVFTALLEK